MWSFIKNIIHSNAASCLTDKQFLEKEIANWLNSPERLMQIKGFLYYNNEHDILHHKRTVIGENGRLEEVSNLPDNHVIDNQYAKLVNQKANYLLGQPVTFECDNKQYEKLIKLTLNKKFMRTLKNAGVSMLNGGIAWLYPCYDEPGVLSFRLFPSYEILPFWSDSEHTKLDMAVRLYHVLDVSGNTQQTVKKVEVFKSDGIYRYIYKDGVLNPDGDSKQVPYAVTVTHDGSLLALNWDKIPLIPLKYNENEMPLIKRVKSLQDGINIMLSTFENNMLEDARNTILVIKGYGGENLGEFRKNLAAYGAVKIDPYGDGGGGVDTLTVSVNAENYKSILELFKKALIENAMGYDAKDDRLSGNPNQMNIRSMYSDIDLDANSMETELQAAFEEILWFANAHLENTGFGNFDNEEVNVIFNRDILINETEAIENCVKSVGIISDETVISQHPWVDDIGQELERLENQRNKEHDELNRQMYEPFAGRHSDESDEHE